MEIQLTVLETIGLSVIASIISVAIIGIVNYLYRKGIYEYIQNAIGQTQINIQGEWRSEGNIDNGNGYDGYFYRDQTTFKQSGRNITGESLYTVTTKDGIEEIKRYSISGVINNDLIVGTYENIDPASVGVGSFVFLIKDDGKKLDGEYLVYNVFSRQIEHWPYSLSRKSKSIANNAN